MTREEAWRIWRYYPAAIGRMCGFRDLTDDLHGRWMKNILYGTQDYTLQAHRLSYKSSCLSVALAMWCVLHHGENALFMRKTDTDTVESITQAKKVFDNEAFRYMAGLLLQTDVYLLKTTNNSLTVSVYDSPRGADQLLGCGCGGSMTGKHANLIVCDDVVNLQDRISRAERERTKAVVQELRNIVTRDGRIVFIGTPWHKEDAFSLVVPPEKHDCYSTGLISPDKLQALRDSMSPSLFAANYELRHIAAENALFADAPRYTDNADMLRDGIAHIDAAYGGEDYTAMTCGRRVGDTLYLYGRLWRAHVDTVLDAALADCNRLMCAPIYCENNGDKGYLGKEIRNRGYEARIYAEKQNKYLKISTYLKKWWKNIVFLDGTDRAYIAQIMDYTEDAEHDDAPDSAADICRLLDKERHGLTEGL